MSSSFNEQMSESAAAGRASKRPALHHSRLARRRPLLCPGLNLHTQLLLIHLY